MKKLLLSLFTGALLLAPLTAKEKAQRQWPKLNEADQRSIQQAIPQKLSAKVAQERKVLVFYRCEGFVHPSIPFGNYTLKQMGEKTGAFSADFSNQYKDLSKENLAQYDLLVFNSTTRLKMPLENLKFPIMLKIKLYIKELKIK